MAFKQLDFEGEAVDLEGALAASTITTATANDHQSNLSGMVKKNFCFCFLKECYMSMNL